MVVTVSESRTIAVPLEAAYDGTAPVPLPSIFSKRHLALPPVTKVTEQVGAWGVTLGQTRVIHTSDGGRLRETLTEVDRPDSFGYRIEIAAGPLRPLVDHLDGRWTFKPADGSDARTLVTWSWDLYPRSALTAPLVTLIGRMWHGYARKALAQLDSILTAA